MLLIETIRTCNRRLENVRYHNERLNRSREQLFGIKEKWDLKEIIQVPSGLPRTLHKCRVVYGQQIEQVEFVPYFPKKITSIELVEANGLDYAHKYADRTALNRLAEKSSADEILIVKNGLLTDASYANIVLFDGEKWLTPAAPLLRGTMRAKLLQQGKIHEADIRCSDLRFFKKIKLVNAMLGFKGFPALDIGVVLG